MTGKLNETQRTEIVRLWSTGIYSLQTVAEQMGVSRQAIKALLNKRGIPTTKASAWRTVRCHTCQKEKRVRRAAFRRKRKHFCSVNCCHLWRRTTKVYIQSRHSQRLARKIVARFFGLQPGNIVHHRDGNTTNNDVSNHLVFRSHSDHLRWHRVGPVCGVKPVWPVFSDLQLAEIWKNDHGTD